MSPRESDSCAVVGGKPLPHSDLCAQLQHRELRRVVLEASLCTAACQLKAALPPTLTRCRAASKPCVQTIADTHAHW